MLERCYTKCPDVVEKNKTGMSWFKKNTVCLCLCLSQQLHPCTLGACSVGIDPLLSLFVPVSSRLYRVWKKTTKQHVNRVLSPAITSMGTEGDKRSRLKQIHVCLVGV